MDSETISPFDAYRSLRKAEAGRQLEKVFRALCYAVHEWSLFGSSAGSDTTPLRTPRFEDNAAPDEGKMLLIEFDKLINIVCRIWSEMFKATGLQRLDAIEDVSREELDTIIRFRPPADEVPGTHGPGTARPVLRAETDEVVYFSEMAELLATHF